MAELYRWLIIIVFAGVGSLGAQTYFQQQVNYHIRARLLPDQDRIEAREHLTYYNHSPDTLRTLYFHLYWNKYQANSYFRPRRTGSSGGIQVMRICNGPGDSLEFHIDNTILSLPLDSRPLLPGDSLELSIEFTAKFPPIEGRFGVSGNHFVAGQWYPVPAVYDADGWHADQHLDGEFYHEWGNYRVDIETPRGYVLAGTGELLNPEVLPDSLDNPNRIIGTDSLTVVYHFKADKIHDFTWVADPDFYRMQTRYRNASINFYIFPEFREDWQEAFEVMPRVMAFLDEKIGPYPYPVLNVVGSDITSGGMEYPNIVCINNIVSSPREIAIVVIHEVVHQWFYGLLANNQTRYGWMDEGFTSFFEKWCTEYLWGEKNNLDDLGRGLGKFFAPHSDSRQQAFLSYAESALSGAEEPIDQHFDYFQHDPYTPTYDKMSVFLFTLKSILGDSLFTRCVRDYYQRWRFRHPSPEALFRSFEHTSGLELEWFWEPFLHTTWQCDIALEKLHRLDSTPFSDSGQYEYELTLSRRQPLPLPVEAELRLKDGRRMRYRIPVAGASPAKTAKPGLTDLPLWHPANRTYTVRLFLPAPVKKVQLDPDNYLPDLNRFNDDSRFFPRVRWNWLRKQYYRPRGDAYPVAVAPFLFYTDPDGIQLGLQSRGEYLAGQYRHYARVIMGHRRAAPDVWLEWQNRLSRDTPRYQYWLRGAHTGGRFLGEIGLFDVSRRALTWQIGYRYFKRTDNDYFRYDPWEDGATGEIFLNTQFAGGRIGDRWHWAPLQISAVTSTIGSDQNFQQIRVTSRHRLQIPALPEIRVKLNSGFSRGEVPVQRRFVMGQANSFQRFWNLYARSPGTIPVQWQRNGHFMTPGGADVRAALSEKTVLPSGNHFLAGELRLPLLDTYYRFPFRLNPLTDLEFSLFTSWAQVWDDDAFQWKNFWGEAGISVDYFFTPLLMRYFHISGIHVDFPLWLRRPGEQVNPWKWRWVLRLDVERFYR